MRVFQIEGEWGFENLKLSTRPQPEPGPGDVLIEMRMASLNARSSRSPTVSALSPRSVTA